MFFASYWGSLFVQFSKLKNFLWVCWFLGKIITSNIPPTWKLDNLYCHNLNITNERKSYNPKSLSLPLPLNHFTSFITISSNILCVEMHQKLFEYASTERPWVSILSRAEGLGASKKIVERNGIQSWGLVRVTKKSLEGKGITLPYRRQKEVGRLTEYALPWRRLLCHSIWYM